LGSIDQSHIILVKVNTNSSINLLLKVSK